jgi:hypothetical protein
MLQLTVTAKNSEVVLQDPFPSDGKWSVTVLPGTTKSVAISWDQFQRIASQVAALELANYCTVSIESLSLGEIRGQENDLVGMPALDHIKTAAGGGGASITAAGVANLWLIGDQLLGQQTIASAILGNVLTPNARVKFYAATPGIQGNDLDVVITDDGGPGSLAITVATTHVAIELHGTAPTASALATAINTAVTGARGTVYAVAQGTGAGTVIPVALTPLTGGSGAGMSATLCGQPCTIVYAYAGALVTDPHTVVIDTPDVTSIAAVGEAAVLYLRSGSKVTSSTHPLA